MRRCSMILWGSVLSAALTVAAPALAQQAGGVNVKGNTTINATAKDVNTMAVGSGNTAVTQIGVINESTRGNTGVTVDVQHIDNIVSGHGRKGCVNIGSTPGKC